LITHDRSLMELVADRLWLVADHGVKPFDGDMSDYAKFVLDRARVAARGPSQAAAPPSPPTQPTAAAGQIGPLKRRLEAAEAVLARETKAAAELDAALADPALYAKDPAGAADLGRRRSRIQEALEIAEGKWMSAAEAYEAAAAGAVSDNGELPPRRVSL
jgi:ATP-binding cassette subfamily F protein 3